MQLPYDLRGNRCGLPGLIAAPVPGDPDTFGAQVAATGGGFCIIGREPVYLPRPDRRQAIAVTDVQAVKAGMGYCVQALANKAQRRGLWSRRGGAAIVDDKVSPMSPPPPPVPMPPTVILMSSAWPSWIQSAGCDGALDWYDYDTGTMP